MTAAGAEVEVREHQILFSSAMVQAILAGRKSMTRRVVKPQPDGAPRFYEPHADWFVEGGTWCRRCPYGVPGDRLWVRETWCEAIDPLTSKPYDEPRCHYRADGRQVYKDDGDGAAKVNRDGTFASPWKPSIFMPRWASRITLAVIEVRVERLQDMTHADWKADFVPSYAEQEMALATFTGSAYQREHSRRLWDSINGKRPGCAWKDNPFVWVVSFARVP